MVEKMGTKSMGHRAWDYGKQTAFIGSLDLHR